MIPAKYNCGSAGKKLQLFSRLCLVTGEIFTVRIPDIGYDTDIGLITF
jgi:hypothetical protein